MEGDARVHDFLHDFAELVDLDGEDAAVDILVAGFGDRGGEGAVDGFDAIAEEILEAEDHRESEAAFASGGDHLGDIDTGVGVFGGLDLDIAVGIDRKIIGAPAVDIVERNSRRDVPSLIHEGGTLGVWRSNAIRSL